MPTASKIAATPSTRLIAPRLALASCVRAIVVRDTTGCSLLPPAQRLNRFPSVPMCCIVWTIAGELEAAGPGLSLADVRMPPALFGGPRSYPLVSYNPGPVHSFVVMFYPAALYALTGVSMDALLDQFLPLESVFDADWQVLSDAILAAPDDETRIRLLEAFLAPRWQAVRKAGDHPAGAMHDWVRRLGVQAASTGLTSSARNVERRIKAWAGQPMRTLRRMRRAEQVFLDEREAILQGTVSWTEVAASGGYADQAHFCRETREITGLTPTELTRAMREDESYWIYRIWS
ncbi:MULTISPECIES: AraC family transcriptional regulator [unclassified Janthinobacterium]|uniref:helix-turn-helix domain-containing protein n=1 Tax=unclassified Janthinobacterium TaxID=2610881 RepID=UPI00162051BB|nr:MULTISPECIES: helix-turn-helix domain-containing protein [unclassified Janthinobacterium]MBB5370675.1 AraC-like DNA-binding protein [Janthinobacterium sp. K2C7]MBB5383481.1 AraC-like DNA-binding protein [Janthinobacterium sp. K2Li3]MBB5388935.1 AraC-like DNA-binding protein [Janthinobacterium sp. K2E3]